MFSLNLTMALAKTLLAQPNSSATQNYLETTLSDTGDIY